MRDCEKRNFTDTQLFYIAFAFFMFMMLYNLTNSSPWGDEWVEFNISCKNIGNGDMYNAIIDTYQPPLYNFLMHFWLKISKTMLWFRLFNVFCGVFIGIFLYKTVKLLTNAKLAAGTLFISGATYHWIYCIQECSEYTLMIMFLCFTFYYYVTVNKSKKIFAEILFILSCVGAMYSQYGAFFIVVPVLCIQLIQAYLSKRKRDLLILVSMYIFSFILFTIPLYTFFARIQIGHQSISEYSNITPTLENLKNFPTVFGKLMGFFLGFNGRATLVGIMVVFGIIVILSGFYILFQETIPLVKKSLISVLLVSYTMYYWLVTFHVYAMTHPNESAGYYSRYAYFFIPTFYVIIPMVFYEINFIIKRVSIKIWSTRIIACIFTILLFIGYPNLLKNWHKTYDREFSEIWLYNAGFTETTYLIGLAKYGFNYYTTQHRHKVTGDVLSADLINTENLPDSFWLWRTNWGDGDIWQETIDSALDQEFKVIIYADYGSAGQLAYCKK